MARGARGRVALLAAWAIIAAATPALGNGGPFIVKYPKGDPAAKGVLARLHPSLKPARETRLEVIKEDLTILFGPDTFRRPTSLPLVSVAAAYTIKNPTREAVTMDFGFPILRGIYISPYSMRVTPSVQVQVDKKYARTHLISNSAIYGVIRQRARRAIEKGIAKQAALSRLVKAVRAAMKGKKQKRLEAARQRKPRGGSDLFSPAAKASRKALAAHLTQKGWSARDAALLVEFASVDLGKPLAHPLDSSGFWTMDRELGKLRTANMGPLGAMGEQRTTQLLARLATRFDARAAAAYESIFKAWGGDVRERSMDLKTGKLRPREVSLKSPGRAHDPTIYARVAYLDPNARITDAEKHSCKRILKNLPVVFTFAPMNLLYYQVKFPAGATRLVTVSYQQHAYVDTRGPKSFQLAYVLHPASLWRSFGPINLKIYLPARVPMKASVPCTKASKRSNGPPLSSWLFRRHKRKGDPPLALHSATITRPEQKKGELFVGIDALSWKQAWIRPSKKNAARQGQGK